MEKEPDVCPVCGCAAGAVAPAVALAIGRGTRRGILAIHQHVESSIVRDNCIETRAAVDLVDQPVGRSDGVVPIAAEDLLRSSGEVHSGLGVYGVGAVLAVHSVLAALAAQAVVPEVFAGGSAAVLAWTTVEQVIATVAIHLQVFALLAVYLVDLLVAVQVYIVPWSAVDHVFAFAAGESFAARSTLEIVIA